MAASITDKLQKIIDDLNIEEAYDFYSKYVYNAEHQKLLSGHGFSTAGSIAPVNWEVFASILTGDLGKEGYGSDLNHFEVKSAVEKGSFEYQYHLNGGKTKLKDDMVVNHVFITYSRDYKNIEVRLVEGGVLKPIFESWAPGLIANYEGPNRKQRYRKSIAFGFVKTNGIAVFRTSGGKLVQG
ncbi:hypothetical protein I8H83_01730 [Candidatus Saccharibacteria bacterium]|nr:hypothetical protein [Candidatus Saccharibacteria bacterium]